MTDAQAITSLTKLENDTESMVDSINEGLNINTQALTIYTELYEKVDAAVSALNYTLKHYGGS